MDQAMTEIVEAYWAQYYAAEQCTLCGNVGIIDSRGVRTAGGRLIGRLNWCICPNGTALRNQTGLAIPRESDWRWHRYEEPGEGIA